MDVKKQKQNNNGTVLRVAQSCLLEPSNVQ
jgi:hypothetical protein